MAKEEQQKNSAQKVEDNAKQSIAAAKDGANLAKNIVIRQEKHNFTLIQLLPREETFAASGGNNKSATLST